MKDVLSDNGRKSDKNVNHHQSNRHENTNGETVTEQTKMMVKKVMLKTVRRNQLCRYYAAVSMEREGQIVNIATLKGTWIQSQFLFLMKKSILYANNEYNSI